MNPRKTHKRGISTVLTTIIILVASVVLGSGVVLYGTSLFQGGTQSEAISVTGSKLWVDPTDSNGLAWGAFAVRNSGDKIVSLDKIQIRGTDVAFANWYPDTTVTTTLVQQPFTLPAWSGTAGLPTPDTVTGDATCAGTETLRVNILPGTEGVCANAASGPLSLAPGNTAIVYFKLNNGTLSSLDSGAQSSLNVFAGKVGAPQSITVSNP